jgi:hypothetical protein
MPYTPTPTQHRQPLLHRHRAYHLYHYFHIFCDLGCVTIRQIMTTINNRNAYFDYHQHYQEEAPFKTIQELSSRDRLQGNITVEILSSPKRKRDEFIGEISWKEQYEQKINDADSMMCPEQKRSASASSTRHLSVYNTSSYDMESRDGPADDESLDDETACLVSNFSISVFRQGQRGITSSASLTRPLPAASYAEDDDVEEDNGYQVFPSIGRARTITDSFDSASLKRCYADPPDMDESSRSASPEVEELTKGINESDHVTHCASDELRERPEGIASCNSFGEIFQARQVWNISTANQQLVWNSDC